MSATTKSTFIRAEFLKCCLICGKTKNKKETQFRALGSESNDSAEKTAAGWVKDYIGLVVSQALCCRNCFLRLESVDIKVKRLRESCRRTLDSLTVSVSAASETAPPHKDEHNYSAGSTGLLDLGVIKVVLNAGSSLPVQTSTSKDTTKKAPNLDTVVGKRGKARSTVVTKRRRAIAPRGVTIAEQLATVTPTTVSQLPPVQSDINTTQSDSAATAPGGGKFQAILPKPLPPDSIKISASLSSLPNRRRTRASSSARTFSQQEKTPTKQSKHFKKEPRATSIQKPKRTGPQAILPKPGPDGQIDLGQKLPAKPEPTVYKCQHCSEEFISKSKYSKHLETHDQLFCEMVEEGIDNDGEVVAFNDKDDPKQCKFCGKTFISKERAAQHMNRMHKHPKQTYKCKLCDHKLTTKRAMHVHLLGHSVSKKFRCQYCDMTFQFKSVYSTHIRLHTKEGAQLCPKCGKIFSSAEGLRLHTNNVHLKNVEKKHVCDVCGKRFERQSKLDFHKASHSDTRDHLCDVCGKTFKHKSILNSHRKIHARDFKPKPPKTKLHGCTVCPKRFGSLSSLADHVTLMHERECILCGASITTWQMLKDHKPICNQLLQNQANVTNQDMSNSSRASHLEQVRDIVNFTGIHLSDTSHTGNSNSVTISTCNLSDIEDSSMGNLTGLTVTPSTIISQVEGNLSVDGTPQRQHSDVSDDAVETLLLALAQGGDASTVSNNHC